MTNKRLAFSFRSLLVKSDAFGGTALAALVIICIVLALLEPQFLTSSNLLNVGRQASVLVIVACGMTLVIISGNIDLSVGSALALCAVVGASLSTSAGLDPSLTIARRDRARGSRRRRQGSSRRLGRDQFVHRHARHDDRASRRSPELHRRISHRRRAGRRALSSASASSAAFRFR